MARKPAQPWSAGSGRFWEPTWWVRELPGASWAAGQLSFQTPMRPVRRKCLASLASQDSTQIRLKPSKSFQTRRSSFRTCQSPTTEDRPAWRKERSLACVALDARWKTEQRPFLDNRDQLKAKERRTPEGIRRGLRPEPWGDARWAVTRLQLLSGSPTISPQPKKPISEGIFPGVDAFGAFCQSAAMPYEGRP